jgi:hypothetical protein
MQMTEPTRDSTGPAAGRPALAWWQQGRVALAAAAVIVLLVAACAWLAGRADVARERMALMEERAAAGFLAPPSTARSVRVDPGSGRRVSLSRGTPERVEVLVDARSNRFDLFRISITRDDGTAVLYVDRLQRDSNGELRFALNSTLLPEGSYTARVEGFTWRGETVATGRFGLTVSR